MKHKKKPCPQPTSTDKRGASKRKRLESGRCSSQNSSDGGRDNNTLRVPHNAVLTVEGLEKKMKHIFPWVKNYFSKSLTADTSQR